ncbi:hypothetical protein KsCSTR_35710 [Candidatus Kuenenia stuttgartiensis]|uniref:Uncharacterized protein n=1 Tax=Kuenenia stuttgartiensis TaxID=174633 RepID=Q1Q6N7_KUEST|nr:hypothetical protein [Candidatus Kuenenia stuttgartiensis]QII12950.1 hypothetical protein KsCSTR_35710 [Candidatus Kuenenia stuttgartiensis]TVL96427.1 MAG: hypothetical protein CV080_11070 [Candidatus Kuenenia stuttgartiensis]CAJ73243.1 unknown protein [Candidatus Kuenenia stuttgartiensis]
MTEVFYKNTLSALKVCKEIPVLTIAFEKSNPQLLFLFLFEEMVVGDFVFLYLVVKWPIGILQAGLGCKPDNHIEGTSERTLHGKMEDTVKGDC